MSILAPVDNPRVSGAFGNSPAFYAQYGQRGHNGTDYAVNVGTPVYATDDGVIVAEGWGQHHNWMGAIAGVFVIIRHSWGYSAYAHLSSTIVDAGQRIKRGQLIAYSGATGVGTGPHLHFETFPLNPNFGNGYAGRVNPAVFGVVNRPSGNASGKPAAKSQKPKPALQNQGDTVFIHIKGKVNARRGGRYLIIGKQAFFIGGPATASTESFTDEAQIARLQAIFSGLK